MTTQSIQAGERTQPRFEARGYSKTGIYSVEVDAADDLAARRKARPMLSAMAFGKIHTIVVTRLNPARSNLGGNNYDHASTPDGI